MSTADDARKLLKLIQDHAAGGVSPSPQVELVFGAISQVTANLRLVSAFLDGSSTPTPGIAYGALPVTPVAGDRGVFLRQRRDGLTILVAVLGREGAGWSYVPLTSPILVVPELSTTAADLVVTQSAEMTGLPAGNVVKAVSGLLLCKHSVASSSGYVEVFDHALTLIGASVATADTFAKSRAYAGRDAVTLGSAPFMAMTGGPTGRQLPYAAAIGIAGTLSYSIRVDGYWTEGG